MLLLALAVLMLIAVLGAVLIRLLEAERKWKREKRELEDQNKKGNT